MKSWQEWPPFLSYMCPITFSIPLQSDSENCTHSFLSYNSVWNFCWRNEHLKVEGGKWKFLCFICYVTASSPLWAIVTILAGETTFKRDTLGSHICLLEYWKNSPQRTKKFPKSHAGGKDPGLVPMRNRTFTSDEEISHSPKNLGDPLAWWTRARQCWAGSSWPALLSYTEDVFST